MRYVALLRAINLGAVRQVKMPALRELYDELGLTDVVTYLQSGNVVFTSPEDDRDALTARLEVAMEERFGFEIPTVVVVSDELTHIARDCPYLPAAAVDPTRVHGLFVDPHVESLDIDPVSVAPEEFHIGERVIYLHFPNRMQASPLYNRVQKATSHVKATARNWRTVEALVGLL